MIKLEHYKEDAFAFYHSIVDSCRPRKERPNFPDEVRALEEIQKNCYFTYDQHFEANALHELESAEYEKAKRKDLQSLYSYRSKHIEKLRIALMKHPVNGRLLNTCQNCTINEVDTMDHIIPQEEFPEFAVHPKNLFPCCTACNRMKGRLWRLPEGERIFLNLYLDPLPTEQLLFVDFDHSWLPTFSIVRPNDLSIEIFNLILSHYQNLNLCNRFRNRSHEVISKVATEIRVAARSSYPVEIIQDIIKSRCSEYKPIIGYNHWQLVLEEALADDSEFIEASLKEEI